MDKQPSFPKWTGCQGHDVTAQDVFRAHADAIDARRRVEALRTEEFLEDCRDYVEKCFRTLQLPDKFHSGLRFECLGTCVGTSVLISVHKATKPGTLKRLFQCTEESSRLGFHTTLREVFRDDADLLYESTVYPYPYPSKKC